MTDNKPLFSRWFMALLLSLGLAQACSAAGDHMVKYSVEGDYDFIRENVVLAITNRGMVVNNVSHVGEMLARTGKDLGAEKEIFTKAEAFEFCSATVSRRMMEADPDNIIFCPYIIAVYVTPDDPKTVNVAYRRPLPVGSEESQAALQAVADLLDGIAREAVE